MRLINGRNEKILKISVLTGTYNRAEFLKNLYKSLLINLDFGLDIEWLIMDDGSEDNTKEVVEQLKKEIEKNLKNKKSKLEVEYFFQKNQGKMVAINNLVEKATGEYIIECDSDDYFTNNAFEIMKKAIEESKNEKDIYGL